MPLVRSNNRNETYEQWRQRMLDETSRFIEWGLQNPDKVDWIPMGPVGHTSRFSERLRSTFWAVLSRNNGPSD
jgi:hypothetical protein